jgi:NAD(P)-dependent dehydrogenase (short-subunit alcohol dehydrogenase family)
MKLEGKVAIVTGAGRSIGQAIATLFAQEGASVVIAEIDAGRAVEAAREIEAAGGRAMGLPTDISRADSVAAMVERTVERFGSIDILVNNAALTGRAVGLKDFLDLDFDHDWKRIIETNLTGTFLCAKEVAERMAKREKGGVILNVSSVSGSCPTRGCTPYGVSKAGVNMLTRTLAGELAKPTCSRDAGGVSTILPRRPCFWSVTKPRLSPVRYWGSTGESPRRTVGWLTARPTSECFTPGPDTFAFLHEMSSKLATLFAYTWDLHDEQVDRALGFISDTAGFNSLCVALSYHTGTYFLPHNPVKKLYYGENGAIYFQPDPGHYADTILKPRVSSVVSGKSYVRRIREAAVKRQVEFSAWIVYFYNHHLAQAYPDCAKVDVFDSPYLSLLCPANPQVRAYAVALTRDIVENCEPQSINLESVSYRHFDYGFLNAKVLVELTDYQRLLMGLCFCPHCLAAADKAGLDGHLFKRAVSGTPTGFG